MFYGELKMMVTVVGCLFRRRIVSKSGKIPSSLPFSVVETKMTSICLRRIMNIFFNTHKLELIFKGHFRVYS